MRKRRLAVLAEVVKSSGGSKQGGRRPIQSERLSRGRSKMAAEQRRSIIAIINPGGSDRNNPLTQKRAEFSRQRVPLQSIGEQNLPRLDTCSLGKRGDGPSHFGCPVS